jgi:competence protein ComEC
MYILISIFVFYAAGIIAYELGFFSFVFTVVFALLLYNSFILKKFMYNSVIAAFLLLSAVNCNYNSNSVLAQHINENMIVRVEIKNKNLSQSDYLSYSASVMAIDGKTLKTRENTILYVDKNTEIEENSIIEIKGNIQGTDFSKNKLLFNYKNYLRGTKIHAVIFAEGKIDVIKKDCSILNDVSLSFKEYTRNTFYSNLSRKNADIVLSIILSESDYLEEDLYNGIKEMGLAHIFAVSGTHIVLMYGAMLYVLMSLGLSRRMSWVLSWSLIWLYGFLIGFPVSVMRSLVMFTLLFGSEVLYRKYSSLNAIGLAALILTVYNPYWIFDAGFLLSFSAALSFILFSRFISKHIPEEKKFLRNIWMYIFLQLLTLPVISYFFNYIPLMGIVYNLLLIPVFTVILAWGFLLLILNGMFSFLLTILFRIFDSILTSIRYLVYFSDNFAFNGIVVRSMTFSEIMFFYTALFICLYLLNNKHFYLKKFVFIVLISFYAVTFAVYPIVDNNLYFSVIDAGQGLFTTVKYKDYYFIIDCGSSSKRGFEEYTAVPYIVKHGVGNVDCAFISHWDQDHCSGLVDILNNTKVKNIFSSVVNEEFNAALPVEKGGVINVDEKLKIQVLWPEEDYYASKKNNTSLVLVFNYMNMNILLPGDIEGDVERLILEDITKTTILVAPHHGSNTSSSEEFVKKSGAEIAVISYGKNNYGIPDPDVVKRYEESGSKVLSTFEQGEINFVLKDGNLYYNTYTGESSENYYKLYFELIIPKLFTFFALLAWMWMKKEECYELQNNNRFN